MITSVGTTSSPATAGDVSAVLQLVLAELDGVRLADRTTASDEQRLAWIELIALVERRAAALKVLLVGEADEANSAMRARQTRLPDCLARSGQQTPGQAKSVMWAGRLLERRPRVRDAAASGRIGLDQAKSIGEALDGLPASLDAGQRRQAEDLILLAAHARENGGGGGLPVAGAAAQLSVIIPYAELLDRASTRGLLTDGTALSAGELRRLACGADLVPVVLDSRGVVLDLGRTIRLAPPQLRLAIGLRDGGCAFPGCRAPIYHCELHHIAPWQEGGPTEPGNLVALCRVHHTLIEPLPPVRRDDGTLEVPDQWQVRIDTHGLPEFIPPSAVDAARTPVRNNLGPCRRAAVRRHRVTREARARCRPQRPIAQPPTPRPRRRCPRFARRVHASRSHAWANRARSSTPPGYGPQGDPGLRGRC